MGGVVKGLRAGLEQEIADDSGRRIASASDAILDSERSRTNFGGIPQAGQRWQKGFRHTTGCAGVAEGIGPDAAFSECINREAIATTGLVPTQRCPSERRGG